MNPCLNSPCGPNSECRVHDDRAVCSCLASMLGAPPNCRPECVIHQDCPPNRACQSQKCQDPCVGSCGFNARCDVQNHRPICTCFEGHDGDPYASCTPRARKYLFMIYFQTTKIKLTHDSFVALFFYICCCMHIHFLCE